MITNTANRNTVTTTVVSPIPTTAISSGTSAEIGALTKMLTHMPSIRPTPRTRAITMPTGRPTRMASAMPIPKERSETIAAALNFPVGRIVNAAAITRVNGGIMSDNFAWPISSQAMNQITSEKMTGIFRPNSVIVDDSADQATYCFRICQISSTVSR